MAENVTGTTVGDVKYVVAYLDVNTNNLYDANGNLYGNNTLTSYLDNEFTLELHYVQDISTSTNPEEWVVWDGLKDLTVSSTLAFDDNYLHAVKGTVVADASAGDESISVDVTDEINKDTLSRYGVLLVNPFGDEEDQLMIPYSSFQQVSGTTFSFIVDDAQGLEASVTKDSPVRVSDPLYMFINVNDVYEANIPNRYEEGVFKFPVNVMSRKLLNALDYSGSTGVSGTMEHKIYTNKNTITGITVTGSTTVLKRDIDDDEVAGVHIAGVKTTVGGDTVYPRDASHDTTNDGTDYYAWMNTENNAVAFYTKTTNVTVGTLLYDEMYYTQLEETVSAVVDVVNPYLFCAWTNGATASPTVFWTKGNEVDSGDSVYTVLGGTATVVSGTTASPNIATELVLFRTFAFPFIVRNLVDYGVSLTIPVEDIDWTKEYVISIIRNNMEEVTGKASQGAYGVVLIGTNIDVADGVISVKNASTDDYGVVYTASSIRSVDDGEVISSAEDYVPTVGAVESALFTKQDNLSAVEPVVLSANTVSLNIATPAEITGGTTHKVISADDLDVALMLSNSIFTLDDFTWRSGSFLNPIIEEDGVYTITGTKDGTSGGIALKTKALKRLLANHRYLFLFDVKNDTPNATRFDAWGANTSYIKTISPYSYVTTIVGEWTRIAIVYGWDTQSNIQNLSFYATTSGSGGTLDFKIRNLHIIDVTSVPEARYGDFLTSSGFLYESGNGVCVNGKNIELNEAKPSDILNSISGKAITAPTLKSALSVAQAVDCTAEPVTDMTVFTNENTPVETTIGDVYKGSFRLKTSTSITDNKMLGFNTTKYYPKAAALSDGTPLKYIIMADITNNSDTPIIVDAIASTAGNATSITYKLFLGYFAYSQTLNKNKTYRAVIQFNANMVSGVNKTQVYFRFHSSTASIYDVTISNLREFEVNALTDDAIAYLATLPDPDSVNAKYLVKQDMVDPWTTIIDMGSAPAVTLASGLAYKSTVTSGSTCTFSTDTCPAGTYGRDAHLTLFVGLDSTVVFQPPLSLMNPLTPGAGHNMTIKYRDGQALAYVDDTDIGYVVTVTAGTENGSLYYGLTSSSAEYIVFSEITDNQSITIPSYFYLSSPRTSNIIGNGIDKTILDMENNHRFFYCSESNGIFTTLSNLTITGGTATTAGGGFYILWGNNKLTLNNCQIKGCTAGYGGGLFANNTVTIKAVNCIFKENDANTTGGGAARIDGAVNAEFINCQFIDNTVSGTNRFGSALFQNQYSGNTIIKNCTFQNNHGDTGSYRSIQGTYWDFYDCNFMTATDTIRGSTVFIHGSNILNSTITGGTVNLAADSVLDITGNTSTKIITGAIYATSGSNVITVINGNTNTIPFSGSGNTLLNNGKLGFLVSVASGTASNTLYDALVGGGTPYSNVIFAPTLDGQTVSYNGDDRLAVRRALSVIGNDTSNSKVTIAKGVSLSATGGAANHYNIQDISISGCTATTNGGAVACSGTYITIDITNCYFANNRNSGAKGGGLYVSCSTASIAGSTFYNNISNQDGGALAVRGTTKVLVINCLFDSNSVPYNYNNGGALCVVDGGEVVTVQGSTFSNNTNDTNNTSGAIAIIHDNSIVNIDACTFTTSSDSIYSIAGSTVTFSGTNILNSTVSGAGTVVFADGATVTSTLPSGSTIGTGVIGPMYCTTPIATGDGLLENVTISGCTNGRSGVNDSLFPITNGKTFTFNNVEINNFVMGTARRMIYTYGGTFVMNNVRVISNQGYVHETNFCYAYNGSVYINNCTIPGCGAIWGNIVLSGMNDMMTRSITTVDNQTATSNIYIVSGATLSNFSYINIGNKTRNFVSIGNFNEQNEWVEGGTATLISGGTTFVVSGTGTYFNRTQTPITDLTIVS